MLINPFVFKKPEPNTFIGGIAKLGGTGVNAPILTAAELADRLGVSEDIIKGFKVVGEDVECHITQDYYIKYTAFGHNLNSEDANKNITSYYDYGGKVVGIYHYAFTNCTNFKNFAFSSRLTYIGNRLMQSTAVEFADFSYLQSYIGGDFSQILENCSSLVEVDMGDLQNSPSGGVGVLFRNCPNLEIVRLKMIYYAGNDFSGSFKAGTIFYNEYCLSINTRTFRGSKLSEIILPNLTNIISNNFDHASLLENFDAKKLKQIGADPAVNYENFLNIKTNALLQVHVDLLTANAGEPDADILYAVNSRNATVMFYDDNGHFVDTYPPISNNLYTQNDAASIGADETDTVGAGWTAIGGIILSTDIAQNSSRSLKFLSTSTGFNRVQITISGLEIGETYRITSDVRCEDNLGNDGLGFFRTKSPAGSNGWASSAFFDIVSKNWQTLSFDAVATDTSGTLELYPSWNGSTGASADGWASWVDNIIIQKIS